MKHKHKTKTMERKRYLTIATLASATALLTGAVCGGGYNLTSAYADDGEAEASSQTSTGDVSNGTSQSLDAIYDTSGGSWTDGKDTNKEKHENGSYLVTIPTRITWSNMRVGTVDSSADYSVNVRGVLNTGEQVKLTATTDDFTIAGNNATGISATVTQGAVAGGNIATTWLPENTAQLDDDGNVIGTNATDSVHLTGIAKYAGDYTVHVNYTSQTECVAK